MRRENFSKNSNLSGPPLRGSPGSSSQDGGVRTRDSSPKIPRPRSEEIPLEDMRLLRKTSLTSNHSTASSSQSREEPKDQVKESEDKDDSRKKRSEETSFTEKQQESGRESRPRRKGQVETV